MVVCVGRGGGGGGGGGGERQARWCWDNFQCQNVLLIWITIGQGPPMLAANVGGVVG